MSRKGKTIRVTYHEFLPYFEGSDKTSYDKSGFRERSPSGPLLGYHL